jgi:hypothetical protein
LFKLELPDILASGIAVYAVPAVVVIWKDDCPVVPIVLPVIVTAVTLFLLLTFVIFQVVVVTPPVDVVDAKLLTITLSVYAAFVPPVHVRTIPGAIAPYVVLPVTVRSVGVAAAIVPVKDVTAKPGLASATPVPLVPLYDGPEFNTGNVPLKSAELAGNPLLNVTDDGTPLIVTVS